MIYILSKEWEKRLFSTDVNWKINPEVDKLCIRHFEKRYIESNNQLLPTAIPTLELHKGATVDDFEELLSAQKPKMVKKKRGSSGKLAKCLRKFKIRKCPFQ